MQEEQKVCPHSKIRGKCESVSNLFMQRVQERKLSIKALNVLFFSSFLFLIIKYRNRRIILLFND